MKNKYLIYLVGLLFIIFFIIYISNKTGYYEYSNNKKSVFTEEKIKEFEKDVAEGKNVNIKDYLVDEAKDYTNKITDFGDGISNFINETVNGFLKGSFKLIQKMVD